MLDQILGTREYIANELGEACRSAKRDQCLVGVPSEPTEWDQTHAYINLLLDDLEAAEA